MSTARVTQDRVMRSEWTKLVSLRSTRITLLVAMAFTLLFALILPTATVNSFHESDRAGFDPIIRTLGAGMHVAGLAFGVLGVLFISGEYATGMIRASMAAVPRRLPVLWAKIAVFTIVTVVLGGLTTLVCFELSQGILARKHLDVAIGDPGVARALLGAVLYMTGIGLLGLGLGTLMRNTAAAITTLAATLYILPGVFELFSHGETSTLSKILPGNAGIAVAALHHDGEVLAPLPGFVIFVLCIAAVTTLAAMTLARRDV